MSEKEEVVKEKIASSGIFDFSTVYSFMHSWLKERQHGVNEEKYSEKISGNLRDIDIEWKVKKKLSDYFNAEYKIEFKVSGLTEVEVEIDGERKNMNKGKIEIKIGGKLVKDPDGKWETSPFSRFMRDIYNKYIIPTRVDSMEDQVANTARNLKEEVKALLEMLARR